ncbi:hypothetical protein [Planosporangium thailandense]|nr:hypothetical protein [Planosporangium thailandense]
MMTHPDSLQIVVHQRQREMIAEAAERRRVAIARRVAVGRRRRRS